MTSLELWAATTQANNSDTHFYKAQLPNMGREERGKEVWEQNKERKREMDKVFNKLKMDF